MHPYLLACARLLWCLSENCFALAMLFLVFFMDFRESEQHGSHSSTLGTWLALPRSHPGPGSPEIIVYESLD